jgi:ribokinase
MKNLVIIGSVGIDNIKTPFQEARDSVGGSSIYAGIAASFFSGSGLVSIAGTDFPKDTIEMMKKRGICLRGIEFKGSTMRWDGEYEYDMNEAITKDTRLNSIVDFNPVLPEDYRQAEYVFLGNIDPQKQKLALDQFKRPRLVVLDTMNFWIESKKDEVIDIIKRIDILIINEGEARMLFGSPNLVKVAGSALELGISAIIIKKGEHGAIMFAKENNSISHFNAPGYPLENLVDPTGCGDSFGGAFIGYLAKTGDHSQMNIRKAIVYASVIASFNAESFSFTRQLGLTMDEIEARFDELKMMRDF